MKKPYKSVVNKAQYINLLTEDQFSFYPSDCAYDLQHLYGIFSIQLQNLLVHPSSRSEHLCQGKCSQKRKNKNSTFSGDASSY